MRAPLLVTAGLVCLLTVPTAPYHSPPLGPHHINPERSFPISSKALFTLGALAVLGGASFYLGKHTGYHAAHKGKLHHGAGYPMGGYHYNPYNQYEVDPYQQYQGFAAGIYAQPVYGYQGRRRRRRGVDEADHPTAASPSSSPSPPPTEGGFEDLQQRPSDSNLLHGLGSQDKKQLVDPRNAGSSKDTPATEPSNLYANWKLRDTLKPPIDLYGLTHNKKYDAIQAQKATKIFFPGDPKLVKRDRRSTLSRKEIVSSDLIHVADDPFSDYKTYRVPTEDVYRDNKRVRFPSTSAEANTARPGSRGSKTESSITEDKDYRIATTVRGTDPRSRFSSGLYPSVFDQQQSLECREATEARNFEHFGLLMLESAMMEDRDGCGLSLVCEVGRVPLERLPPKALGLRKLLTGRKPRGLDGDLWGTLTQSLLTGLSHGDCGPRYPSCPAPPQELLRVFAEL